MQRRQTGELMNRFARAKRRSIRSANRAGRDGGHLASLLAHRPDPPDRLRRDQLTWSFFRSFGVSPRGYRLLRGDLAGPAPRAATG
jgi:hypothetical protein